jgi:hypothetical protein
LKTVLTNVSIGALGLQREQADVDQLRRDLADDVHAQQELVG